MTKTLSSLAPALVALGVLATPVAAQLSHIGAHVGYDFDGDDTVVGGQLSLPLNRVLELYPSVDVYLVDVGLLGGLESRFGYTHPYVEGRALHHDRSAFQLNAGLNITLF